MRDGNLDERGVAYAVAYDFLGDRLEAFEAEHGETAVGFSSEEASPTGATVMGEPEHACDWALTARAADGASLLMAGNYTASDYPGGQWLKVTSETAVLPGVPE